MLSSVFQVDEWISENEKFFVPPVCNKCMYSDQLKVFFVGGPNQRKDYHLEEGEEVFYQVKGDMLLKVVENGIKKDIPIKQGEIFLLPSRVEHSPQRFENTIGFVVERERRNTEFECIRYFVGDSTERLYERWMHLHDVVMDLPPIIKGFFASEECKTGVPGANSFTINAPFEPRKITFNNPINLDKFIEEHKSKLENGPVTLYGAPDYKTTVKVYGKGKYLLTNETFEMLCWIKSGDVIFNVDGSSNNSRISASAMMRVSPGKKLDLDVQSGGIVILIQMEH